MKSLKIKTNLLSSFKLASFKSVFKITIKNVSNNALAPKLNGKKSFSSFYKVNRNFFSEKKEDKVENKNTDKKSNNEEINTETNTEKETENANKENNNKIESQNENQNQNENEQEQEQKTNFKYSRKFRFLFRKVFRFFLVSLTLLSCYNLYLFNYKFNKLLLEKDFLYVEQIFGVIGMLNYYKNMIKHVILALFNFLI